MRRVATYVDRIFKGASSAELPVEQATVLKLAINLKTAKTFRTRRSSGRQAPGRHVRPPRPLFFLLHSVSWSGDCPEEYKALGLTIPPPVLARADEIIE
jgi:hypothetical protein